MEWYHWASAIQNVGVSYQKWNLDFMQCQNHFKLSNRIEYWLIVLEDGVKFNIQYYVSLRGLSIVW